MAEVRVAGLQLHHAVHVGRLGHHLVAVVIREELDDLPLLVGGQNVQEDGCVSSEPGGKQIHALGGPPEEEPGPDRAASTWIALLASCGF